MIVQHLNIASKNMFEYYSRKYEILEIFFEKNFSAFEIREVDFSVAKNIQQKIDKKNRHIFLANEYSGNLTDIILLTNISNLNQKFFEELKNINTRIAFDLERVFNNYYHYDDINFEIGEQIFTCKKSYVMGILNVTPDSFSDGGKYFDADSALEKGLRLIIDGADIIDIGGESTRPGAEQVSVKDEIERVVPIIEKLKTEKPDILISIDTTKSEVAEAAANVGANIINDISGGTFDENIFNVAADNSLAYVLMHIQGTPQTMQKKPTYTEINTEIYNFLKIQSDKALEAGIKNIIIDPGIGFGKTVQHNFQIIENLSIYKGLGYPILIGNSKKSFLGKSLNLEINERENASVVTDTISIMNGAVINRTHDVKKAVEAKKILSFIKYPNLVANV